jgi:DNA-binding transcriptional LysR family regulator
MDGIEVVEDNTTLIEKMILQDTIDIGIVEGDFTSNDLYIMTLLEDELVFICSTQHPFATLGAISLDALSHENFILREIGSGTRKKFEDVMRDHQLQWQSNWTCNNADTIAQF